MKDKDKIQIEWGISFDKQIENFVNDYEIASRLGTDSSSLNNELVYYLYKQLQVCQEQIATKTDEGEELKTFINRVGLSVYDITKILDVEPDNIDGENIYFALDEINQEVKRLSKENTALKLKLDYIQNNLNSAVEALDKIKHLQY